MASFYIKKIDYINQNSLKGGEIVSEKRPYIKYLNPVTGKYEFPTLPDIGSLSNLKTEIKTDLVSAINHLVENGVPAGEINGRIDQINEVLEEFSKGEWTPEQLASLESSIDQIVTVDLTEFQQGIDAQKDQWNQEVQGVIDGAREEYTSRLTETERVLSDATQVTESSRQSLEQAREDLNKMELNVAGYEEKFNEIDNTLETVVYETEFDLMTAEFVKNETIEVETAEGIERKSITQLFSAMDGRVASAEGFYKQTSEELSNRLTFEQLQGTLDTYQFSKYGDNLLLGTRDFRDWDLDGAIISSGSEYRQGNTARMLSATQELTKSITGLKVGKTYVASISLRYEGGGNPIPYLYTEGDEYAIDAIYEDTRQFDNWIRYYVKFIAEREAQIVKFYVQPIPLGEEVFLSNIKIEYGERPTPWKPHIDDTFYELEVHDSRLIQQANSITQWLRKIAGDDNGSISDEALWQITAEGLLGQAKTIKDIEDGKIQQETAQLIMNSDEFATRMTKTVDDGISSINVDNRNRVLNSSFIFNFEQWLSVHNGYELQDIGGVKFARISRNGLLSSNPATLRSNLFKVSNYEDLMISFDVFTPEQAKIDNKTIVRIDLYDISDIRIGYKEFTISELTGDLIDSEVSRLTAKYKVNNSQVAKGQVTLQLHKNGDIGFSRLFVQNSNIEINDWSPAPEDIIMIQLRMDTYIEQDAESVAIGAVRQEIEKGREDEASAFHDMWTQIKVAADNFELSVKKDGVIQSINGSDEELLIDFEKIRVTGELLADLISAENLDVSKGFRIMNGNLPIIQANSNGEVEMNIQKLRINSLSALTEADKPSIEENVANELENKIKPYTHYAYADDDKGTNMSFSPKNKAYIGIYTDYIANASSDPNKYAWVKAKGDQGPKGNDGYTPIKGVDYFDGNDGISIVEIKEYYLASDKDAGITITGYDWKDTFQPISETKPYLWNYERIEYSNGLSDTFGPNIIGRYASDGEKGEAGRGITSITEYYLTSSEDTGILIEGDEDWSTTFQQTTATNRYLWNYEEIAYTDGTKDIVGPSIIGTHGMKGDSPIVAYLSNDSHLVPSDADGLNANYENAYTEMYIMDGIEDDTESYKFSAKESSGIVGNIEGNKYTVTSLSGDLAEVKITATKGNFSISKVFTVSKSKQGIRGQDGEDSLIYQLETDSLVLTREVDETLNPSFINIQAVSMKGNDPKKPFTGYFRIHEQHTSTFVTDDFTKLALESGITEEEYIISLSDEPRIIRYESIFKESSLKYEPRADAISVYIQLFEDSSFNEVLDSQTVVIVSHGPKGEDAYRVEVLSRNGNTFKNGVVDTWLYAVVYKGEEDITDELDISRFRWERVSEDSASDTKWNQKYFGGTKEIRITTEDVYKRATFTCSITKQ